MFPIIYDRVVTLRALLAEHGVRETATVGNRVGILALHGGLEAGTSEIAQAAAERCGAGLYTVDQPAALAWHVPSIEYHPGHSTGLDRVLSSIDLAVSLHGYGRPHLRPAVLLGGGNRWLASALARYLRYRGVPVIDRLEEIPAGLRGLHAANPVNLPPGGGVQVELPVGARQGNSAEAVVAAIIALAALSGPTSVGIPPR